MSKGILKRILKYLRTYKFFSILALITALIGVSLTLYVPVLIGKAVDLIVGKGNADFKGLVPVLITLGVFALVGSLFQWFMSLFTNKLVYNTINDIRQEAFNKIESVPLKYVDSKSQGDLISRIVTDTEIISDGLLQTFNQVFTGLITILGTLIFMLTINISIALIVVVLTPLSLFVASFISKNSFKMFKVQSETRGEMTGYVEEIISNQNIVKAFSQGEITQEKFEEINSRLYSSGVKAQFYSSLTNPSTRFVNGLVYTSVGIIGAMSVLSGKLSVGALSSFLAYANQYTKPFNEISGVVTELQNAFASATRIFEIIDEPSEVTKPDDKIMTECDGSINISDVYFSYSPERKLIEDFNLNVKPGQRIAIVGPTGCGKTTLINLLMRFYDVNSGKIVISGNNINELTRDSLRSQYGMVLQETWLKNGTIKENIAFGKPDATDEEIINAAKQAYADVFIRRLPDGYNTIISDDGESISQGQKQLLCIARIMLILPPMLILDEATSSIDTRTEINIQKAFVKMMTGRTSFIVAHRLSTIKEADVILVMNQGKIIEQGSHYELLKAKGFYSNLYNSQFSNEKDDD